MGRIEIFTEGSMSIAQNEAIEAARRGDWTKADEMELAYLNQYKRHIFPVDLLAQAHDVLLLRATKLYRGLAPNGQIGVRWTTATKQQEEEGDYDDDEVWFTDIDGNLIEVDRETYN